MKSFATLRRATFVVLFSMLPGIPDMARSQCPAGDITMQGILQDYLYGYAPVAMEATRAILTAAPDNTMPGVAPVNQFAYSDTLSTPEDHLIVRPNADTLYTGAWLDLTKEPIILHVPDVGARYYLIPMLDAYSNEFASIGSRTTGSGAGNYAIVGSRWQGYMPKNISGVIKAPTNTVWLLGRTLVNGPSDLQNAIAISKQYQLIPLSAYQEFLETGSYMPPRNVAVTPPNPDFFSFPVTNSAGFSKPEFFDVLARYAVENPPLGNQPLRSGALVADGFLHQNQLSSDILCAASAAMLEKLSSSATIENGWSFNLGTGSYGTDYVLRAAVAKFGFGANLPADAIYMHGSTDISGIPLTGAASYAIHFAPGQTPPEQGFWSVTVYDENGFLVSNSINRYDVGSQTGLVANPDGSLDISLRSSPPQAMQSNWLPIPTGAFSLTLRIYWPDPAVLNGAWMPPPVVVTDALP